MMKPYVTFEHFTQEFGRPDGGSLRALQDVSLDIGRHEFIAVVAPLGCGCWPDCSDRPVAR